MVVARGRKRLVLVGLRRGADRLSHQLQLQQRRRHFVSAVLCSAFFFRRPRHRSKADGLLVGRDGRGHLAAGHSGRGGGGRLSPVPSGAIATWRAAPRWWTPPRARCGAWSDLRTRSPNSVRVSNLANGFALEDPDPGRRQRRTTPRGTAYAMLISTTTTSTCSAVSATRPPRPLRPPRHQQPRHDRQRCLFGRPARGGLREPHHAGHGHMTINFSGPSPGCTPSRTTNCNDHITLSPQHNFKGESEPPPVRGRQGAHLYIQHHRRHAHALCRLRHPDLPAHRPGRGAARHVRLGEGGLVKLTACSVATTTADVRNRGMATIA